MRKRGFEIVRKYIGNVSIPKRATKASAGYDFEAAEDTVVPSIWKFGVLHVLHEYLFKGNQEKEQSNIKPTLVPTGIKSYMEADEYLQLCNRSSNAFKRGLFLANGVGIIDSDYYNNEDNEGHIQFLFVNFGLTDQVIKKGERIGQGIFLPFLKADQDDVEKERSGGFGSSGM